MWVKTERGSAGAFVGEDGGGWTERSTRKRKRPKMSDWMHGIEINGGTS